MNTVKKLSGAAIATAAASLLLAGCSTMDSSPNVSETKMTKSATPSANEAKVHCGGVNACKGQSACNTANNACQGQNSCKGQGWIPLTKDECDVKGGEVLS